MHHYRIKRYENNKFSIDTQDQRPTMFNSIPELIKFFDEKNNVNRCKLTTKYKYIIKYIFPFFFSFKTLIQLHL